MLYTKKCVTGMQVYTSDVINPQKRCSGRDVSPLEAMTSQLFEPVIFALRGRDA
jgi:hypothetical protein